MVNNINQYFVTCNIYKGEEKVHEISCPISMLEKFFVTWKWEGSPYTIKVVDHTGNFRISSDIFNEMR